ncbi:hypothetical protein [Gracilibacillus caseinilyticus]
MYPQDRQVFFFPFFPGSGSGGGQWNPWGPGPGGPGGPGGGPGGPPPFGPPGSGGGAGMPPGPPPQQVPAPPNQLGDGPQLYAVDPGSIRGCLYRYTYIWLNRFNSFWFYPTYIGRQSVSGYRWTGFNWVYFGIDLDRINSFTCV